MFFWNSFAFFSMIQWMLAVWSLIPLPFLNSVCTSGSFQAYFINGKCRSSGVIYLILNTPTHKKKKKTERFSGPRVAVNPASRVCSRRFSQVCCFLPLDYFCQTGKTDRGLQRFRPQGWGPLSVRAPQTQIPENGFTPKLVTSPVLVPHLQESILSACSFLNLLAN